MPYQATNRFQYNFTSENELYQLRESYKLLQYQHLQLKKQCEQLIKSNQQLVAFMNEDINRQINLNTSNSNPQQMQIKIDSLTSEVDVLKRLINQVQFQKYSNDKHNLDEDQQDIRETDKLVGVLQQLTQSFQNMQDKYQQEIQNLQKDLNNLRSQWTNNYHRLEQQYSQKIHTFQDVIVQLKRKDELVQLIQQKLKLAEQTLTNFTDDDRDDKPTKNQDQQLQEQLYRNNQEREMLINQIQEKDRVIKVFQRLINNLRIKISQKN